MIPLRGDGGTGIVKSLKEGKAFFWCKQWLLRPLLREKYGFHWNSAFFIIIRIRISKNSIFIININRSNNMKYKIMKFCTFHQNSIFKL